MGAKENAKHVLTMLVDNQPGVLSRVVGLFSGRGFNIDSLCVAETMDPKVSRITLVTRANELLIEQIEKQLRKLINVIKVRRMTREKAVQREMALVCVHTKSDQRAEVLRIADIFRCNVVDAGLEHFILEVTGDEEKISAMLNLLRPIGIQKIARTGTVALFREPK
ncbi:acetolactate synthase small subunit [Desulfatirhabdium butyrativorans]|jgi:acetolactate synthase-1/3 small subunit|uniref:acetolactate synthase small subunit n=1 Tax=Desulfatirhabdium butyrativorans TaxID=340467 RepID=UPI000421A64E|nr:acetolactate synthase small subunit [Desulfatirhabdium butyrativorans]